MLKKELLKIRAIINVHFSLLVALTEEQIHTYLTERLYENRRSIIEERYGAMGGKIEELKYHPLGVQTSLKTPSDYTEYVYSINMEVSGVVHPF